MAEFAAEVETAISRLDKYRDVVRETFGMEAGERLEKMLHGPSGKRMIRYTLTNLVDYALRIDADPEIIRNKATEVLTFIEELNGEFLHGNIARRAIFNF